MKLKSMQLNPEKNRNEAEGFVEFYIDVTFSSEFEEGEELDPDTFVPAICDLLAYHGLPFKPDYTVWNSYVKNENFDDDIWFVATFGYYIDDRERK